MQVERIQLAASGFQQTALMKYNLTMAFRFMSFRVYIDAKKLHRRIVFITKSFPHDYYYLKDQLRRAVLSIILNIAEGSGKGSDKDFNRYLGNALGSVNEIGAALDVACDEELLSHKELEIILSEVEEVKTQLGSFSKKLKVGS